MLAAFLMEPDRPPGGAWPQIFDLHFQGGGDARETVRERRDQRAVTEVAKGCGWNGIEELAPFLALEYRRRAGFDDVLRPADGRCRLGRDDLADDEPVEQHPHGGELLLDQRRRSHRLKLLYI